MLVSPDAFGGFSDGGEDGRRGDGEVGAVVTNVRPVTRPAATIWNTCGR